jgi:hypothetical protein
MIRWEEDFGEYAYEHEWLGYLGKVIICVINSKHDMLFNLTGDGEIYTKLSSAKRGAERMLERFLKDTNLTVRGNIFEGGE